MRTMNDAVTPANINPAGVQLVAGYLNGRYAWSQADWDRFPRAVHVGISVRASFLAGHVLDVERGDATPAESVGWVKARRAAGADPTVYCNRSTWVQVQAAFRAAGVAEPHYWIATGSGRQEIPVGAVAAQYLLDVAPGIDVSVVADYWPGVDGTPTTPGTPGNLEEDSMITVPAGTDEHMNVVVKGKTKLYIACSWNHTVQLHAVLYFGDTGTDPKGTGVGGGYDGALRTPPTSWRVDPNRPGPFQIPEGAAMATIRFTADHAFAVGVA